MTLETVRQEFASTLMARPALAQFSPIIIVNGEQNQKQVIAARNALGACLVISELEIVPGSAVRCAGRVALRVNFLLGIYEQPATTHAPAGIMLEKEVIIAWLQNVRFDWDQEPVTIRDEVNGGTISIFNFEAKVTIEAETIVTTPHVFPDAPAEDDAPSLDFSQASNSQYVPLVPF